MSQIQYILDHQNTYNPVVLGAEQVAELARELMALRAERDDAPAGGSEKIPPRFSWYEFRILVAGIASLIICAVIVAAVVFGIAGGALYLGRVLGLW